MNSRHGIHSRMLAGLLLLASAGVWAADAPVIEGQWIVHLEAPPAVSYRGDDVIVAQAGGQRPAGKLAPTAPAVTGAARLRADAPAVRAYAAFLDGERTAILERAGRALGRDIQALHVYRYLSSGFAARMSAGEAATLARLPGVAAVEPDRRYRLHLDRGPGFINADMVWNGQANEAPEARGEGVIIGVIDSGINWEHDFFSDDPELSDGYEYVNPLGQQLGLCSRSDVPCNDKLIGVYEFTDIDTTGKDTGGHGSHVAATAAGNDLPPIGLDFGGGASTYPLSGVAPRAHIVSYKACIGDHPDDPDQDGSCSGSALRRALEQAVEDGVDVVNYSIGAAAGDPWSTIGDDSTSSYELFLNLRDAGIVAAASAGNHGGEGHPEVTAPGDAPWVVATANSTHDRLLANRVDVANQSNLPGQYGSGPEVEGEITAGVIVAGDVDSGNQLACEPFPPGAFSGAIAVVTRGDCFFSDKVGHAADAGAVAVLVVNNVAGAAVAMAGLEDASIPALTLRKSDGEQAIEAIGFQDDPTATLHPGAQRFIESDLANRINPSSSRGPAGHDPGVMKPNITAPGTSILSAGIDGGNAYNILTGTSMASPHVAGSMALLLSLNPDWTPDIVQSVLETTADAAPLIHENAPAGSIDRGTGLVQVDRAVSAGLYLPVTTDEFISAHPAAGGSPSQLNLAGISHAACVARCTFVRRVRALESGTWQVSVEGGLQIAVSHDELTLAQGEQATLEITVERDGEPLGEWHDASVVLTPDDGSLSTQRLAVGVAYSGGELPERIEIAADDNRGSTDYTLESVDELEQAVFLTGGLERPRQELFNLPQDSNNSDPFDGNSGTRTFLIEVPGDALVLYAETIYSTAPDIDLFVGFDSNGDGQASEEEVICESTSPDEIEECRIDQPPAGPWWVLVQNWNASGSGSDDITLEFAALGTAQDYSLAVSGPGYHPGGSLDIDIHWDQPAMKRPQEWVGAIGISSSPDAFADVGVIPVVITREQALEHRPTALFAGETRAVVLASGSSHEHLFVDVPPGTDQVTVGVEGESDVSGELVAMAFDDVEEAAPGTPAASGPVLDSGSGSGSGFTLSHGGPGSSPSPGRYYVVLENDSAAERRVDVTVDLSQSERMMPRFGLWASTTRNNAQGWEWNQVDHLGFMVWYTYDRDGLPVFYITDAQEVDQQSGSWSAPLLRATANDVRQNYAAVGRLAMTVLGEQDAMLAWRVNGEHGVERIRPFVDVSCPEIGGNELDLQGVWTVADHPEGGASVAITADTQAWIRYYFDRLGMPRWVEAAAENAGPETSVLEVLEYRGGCPNCEDQQFDSQVIGMLEREFHSETRATVDIEFMTREPLDTEYSNSREFQRLSSVRSCP